jgi:hypothetical protein
VLAVLTIWGLAMIVPELYRVIEPLGSFGFFADNNGLIIDVRAPFADELESPAYQAGLRPGERLDLTRMRCIPLNTPECATTLAVFGGLQFVTAGRHGLIVIAASADRPARQVEIVAERKPRIGGWNLVILLLDQVAGILVVLAGAWLVWTRASAMTWGFFLYVVWFNPGQWFTYYALLQHSPIAFLGQNIAGSIAQGAGYAGFLLFALRAPSGERSVRWRRVEWALPFVGAALAIVSALGYRNLFGYPAETLARSGILSGLAVPAAALAILLARRKELPPYDYQRLRWVIWGCLIGLPAIVLANLTTETTLLAELWPQWPHAPPPDTVSGFLYLINGVLTLFVTEAVRRSRVVSVAIPLRRVTILGLLLSVPSLFLHQEIEHLREVIDQAFALAEWMWIAIAAGLLFLISRIHEETVHYADRYFNRGIAKAGRQLGHAILHSGSLAEVESELVHGVRRTLDLASAALFQGDADTFRRGSEAEGWDDAAARTLDPNDPMLAGARPGRPFRIDGPTATRNGLPAGLARPVLGVPIGDRFRCWALALYGPHATGEDLNHDERAMLAELADAAASVVMKLDHGQLRDRIATLESELAAMTTRLGALGSPSPGRQAASGA